MKARFVFENIDFERGQDPKKAMGLGPEDMIWNWANEFPEMEGIIGNKEHAGDWHSILTLAINKGRNDFLPWILNNKDVDPNDDLGYPMKIAAIGNNMEALEILEKYGGDIALLNTMVATSQKDIRKIKQEFKKFKKKKLNASR